MTWLVRALQLRYVDGRADRRVTWLELFFDLVFVAAVAQVGEPLREEYTAAGLVRFAVLFVLIWWAWIGNSVFATRFATDDAMQRLLTLIQMFAVAVMAANASEALSSRSSAGFAAAYAAVRVMLVAQYARARQIDVARGLATRYMIGHGLAAALWLASSVIPAPPRYVVWAVALAIDLATPWFAVSHSVEVPPNAAHLPERFGLFTLILLGESVVAVMHGMKSQEDWSLAAASSAFLGMAFAFAVWWWYFEKASGGRHQHIRCRADAVRFQFWGYAHFPLYLGVVVAGIGVERSLHHGALFHLDAHDAAILAAALLCVTGALLFLGAVGPRPHHMPAHGS